MLLNIMTILSQQFLGKETLINMMTDVVGLDPSTVDITETSKREVDPTEKEADPNTTTVLAKFKEPTVKKTSLSMKEEKMTKEIHDHPSTPFNVIVW